MTTSTAERTAAVSTLAEAPLHVCGDVAVRLLALEVGEGGDEAYRVSFRPAPEASFRAGQMRHVGGASWEIADGSADSRTSGAFGSPDEVFRLALGQSRATQDALAAEVTRAAPHWPAARIECLAQRRLSGCGTVAFDGRWFLTELATSAFDRPLIFPNATSRLGLAVLEQASAIVRSIAPEGDGALVEALARALRAGPTTNGAPDWGGEGRLIAVFSSGELAQLGSDIRDGCQVAIGTGPLAVVFDPGEPLGLGLGPLIRADVIRPDDGDSVGMGVVVGEVDEGGAADRAGVRVGMALARLSDPDRLISSQGRSSLPFEEALDDIDARRAAGQALTITFDTAAAVTRRYAVEMPAEATLAALATVEGSLAPVSIDVGAALNRMCAGALLWREEIPRLFVGEPGSVTCAHTDICPQLEIAHGLHGIKLLGVASHDATPGLLAEHGDAGDSGNEDATVLPTDRPLSPHQSHLLDDADLTLVLLHQGDLAVLDSGALHIASNGAEGISAALYHGAITPAAVPRLRIAAKATDRPHDDAYRHHLFAADLLREVEPLLALLHATNDGGRRQ